MAKISIVIPVYNGSDYLGEAIESALQQDYANFEVIVVNDGSNDDGETERIALSYGDSIRYFYKSNGGVASALNYAIDLMEGDYFSWLSHDDLYYPTKLSRQMEVLSQWPSERCIVYSPAEVFSSDKNACSLLNLPKVYDGGFRYFLATSTALHGCSLLIPRCLFAVAGKFNEKLRTTQDYDMWFRLASHCEFIKLDEVLVKARAHPNQGSIVLSKTVVQECSNLICDFLNELNDMDVKGAKISLKAAYLEIAKASYRRGLIPAGRQAIEMYRLENKKIYNFLGWGGMISGEMRNYARIIIDNVKKMARLWG